MAAKITVRTTSLAAGLILALSPLSPAVAQTSTDFTMRVEYAVTYTELEPEGRVDDSPPYTLCGNNQMAIRFRYTWRKNFQEYIYTEPVSELFPYMYMQGVNPNPLYVQAAPPGSPVVKLVNVGLISGQVNTGGLRQVIFRGRTSGFFGSPTLTANSTVLIETQIPPRPTVYREIRNAALDMPTRPWLVWEAPLSNDRYRLDVGLCSIQNPGNPDCGTADLPSVLNNPQCGTTPQCWEGTQNERQLTESLETSKKYQYRVYGINECGLSPQPPLPSFRTAQACFLSGASIPDGGSVSFDAATATQSLGSLAADLRVTVHTDHTDVSDLRISLTKTSPVAAGPLLLMDRPTGTDCVNGKRIQTAFADNGAAISGGCNAQEPAISGRTAPLQALASFAPLEGAGTWRLTVEDTQVDGKTGSLLEWCLSTDPQLPPLQATAFVNPILFADGFE